MERVACCTHPSGEEEAAFLGNRIACECAVALVGEAFLTLGNQGCSAVAIANARFAIGKETTILLAHISPAHAGTTVIDTYTASRNHHVELALFHVLADVRSHYHEDLALQSLLRSLVFILTATGEGESVAVTALATVRCRNCGKGICSAVVNDHRDLACAGGSTAAVASAGCVQVGDDRSGSCASFRFVAAARICGPGAARFAAVPVTGCKARTACAAGNFHQVILGVTIRRSSRTRRSDRARGTHARRRRPCPYARARSDLLIARGAWRHVSYGESECERGIGEREGFGRRAFLEPIRYGTAHGISLCVLIVSAGEPAERPSAGRFCCNAAKDDGRNRSVLGGALGEVTRHGDAALLLVCRRSDSGSRRVDERSRRGDVRCRRIASRVGRPFGYDRSVRVDNGSVRKGNVTGSAVESSDNSSACVADCQVGIDIAHSDGSDERCRRIRFRNAFGRAAGNVFARCRAGNFVTGKILHGTVGQGDRLAVCIQSSDDVAADIGDVAVIIDQITERCDVRKESRVCGKENVAGCIGDGSVCVQLAGDFARSQVVNGARSRVDRIARDVIRQLRNALRVIVR